MFPRHCTAETVTRAWLNEYRRTNNARVDIYPVEFMETPTANVACLGSFVPCDQHLPVPYSVPDDDAYMTAPPPVHRGPSVAAAADAAAAAGSCGSAVFPSALPPLVCILLVLVLLQAALLAVLGLRLRRAARAVTAVPTDSPQPRRPRTQLKKRFVAVGRQLRPRPPSSRPDIEDCCQMTLCETVRPAREGGGGGDGTGDWGVLDVGALWVGVEVTVV